MSYVLNSFRTFNYRNVASLMCECTPNCLEVATLYGTGLYNMQGRRDLTTSDFIVKHINVTQAFGERNTLEPS